MAGNILPDTGLYVVKDGAWVESTEPEFVEGGVWSRLFEATVQVGGSWKKAYLRLLDTTLTLTSDPQPDLITGVTANSGTVTGTIMDSLDRPVPNATLTVTRVVTDENGSAETALPSITSDANGDWTMTYDLGVTALQDYGKTQHFRIEHEENLPLYAASSVSTQAQQINSASVTLTFTQQTPAGSFTAGVDTLGPISGTAFKQGGIPAEGTVTIILTRDNGVEGSPGEVAVSSDGTWSIPDFGTITYLGKRTIIARYTPVAGGVEDPTALTGNTIQVGLKTPSLNKGSVGETSISVSMGSVPGSSGSQFYNNGVRRYSGSSSSYTRTGLANYKEYPTWKVRAYGYTPAGATVYSSFSSEHDARTGRPEKRDSGSKTVTITPSATGSWRSEDAWAWLGDKVGQGTYGSYSSYRGVIDFGGANNVRNALRTGLGGDGTARQQKGSCTKAEVYLYKIASVGTSGAVTVRFHRASSDVGGGIGSATYMKAVTSSNGGSGKWYDVGTSMGQLLGDGDQNTAQSRSIQIRNDGTGAYAQFNGRSAGGSNCRLRLTWAWDYVTQTKVSGTWLN